MNQIIEWMNIMCGKDIIVAQGKNYDYLGMELNLSIPWEVRVTMVEFT